MRFKSWEDFAKFENDVRFNNRFVHSQDSDEFLSNIKLTLLSRLRNLPIDYPLYRSQIGHDEIFDGGNLLINPLPPTRMKPIPNRAQEGRANPKGIAYLYLSNDENTSMAELRPHKGQFISCSTFKVTHPLRIIDCYSVEREIGNVECIFNPPQAQSDIANVIWKEINYAFTKPVSNDHSSSEYVPTQILAELFKREGYDGICYKSLMGPGHNFLLFDMNNAELVASSVKETEHIHFTFKQITQNAFPFKR